MTRMRDPAAALRRLTGARVALGRAGVSLPTRAHLDFQADHAAARDAVLSTLDAGALAAVLAARGWPTVRLRSAAPDRAAYLARPDLGRRLDPASAALLSAAEPAPDVALVVADGLSAAAVQAGAAPLLDEIVPRLAARRRRLAPIAIVEQGRVAIADPIGAALGARLSVILIGERPGLSAADSLGLYLTWAPRPGRTDAERNCISNIRARGLGRAQAAEILAFLVDQAFARGLSGVALKYEPHAMTNRG